MPNTNSAERRMRSNERKHLHNRTLLAAGKKEEAAKLLPGIHSAFDKAVKSSVLSRTTGNRKKSRLANALNGLK